jgi:hypothetical protein
MQFTKEPECKTAKTPATTGHFCATCGRFEQFEEFTGAPQCAECAFEAAFNFAHKEAA